MFFFAWSRRPAKVKSSDGYFNCPTCKDRQPADLRTIRLRTYLYFFIPLGLGEQVGDREFYWCKKCHREFTNDGLHGYDFSVNYTGSPNWNCFKCSCPIPHEELECPSCGWNFYTGQYRNS